MNGFRAWIICLLAVCVFAGSALRGQERSEEDLYAAVTLSTLQYVRWDGVPKVESGEIVRIGVYDPSAGSRYFESFERFCERVEVYDLVRIDDPNQIDATLDVLFFAGQRRPPDRLIEATQGLDLLVVGLQRDILEQGGVMRLEISRDGRCRFVTSRENALERRLTLGSRLLRLERRDG